MDDQTQQLVEQVIEQQGVSLETLLVGLAIYAAHKIAELIAKEIPDSKTGAVGRLRQVLKFVGAYRSNQS